MQLVDALTHPRVHALASVISLGIAALSFFTVVISLVITRMAVRSGTITRLVSRRRLKVICAFSALTGLSGALSIALEADIHSIRSFLVGELSIAAAIMLFTLFCGVIASASALASGDFDANEEDGHWHRQSIFNSGAYRPTTLEQDDYWRGRDAFDSDADRPTINPASGYLMCGSVDTAGNLYGTCTHHIGDC
jgi:hypothetical protein